jgi:hypothetical protein
MTRRSAILAAAGAVLVLASLTGWVWFVLTVGLDESDKVASVASFAVSTFTGVAALVAAYRAPRLPLPPPPNHAPSSRQVHIGNLNVNLTERGNIHLDQRTTPDWPDPRG